ncbi:MAG: protein phosphatase 2C domain-containing protein [Anaerolineae bacterium]|nr:protein phosphatase 2C domain-containing protein [Anaerolineae bacterium]
MTSISAHKTDVGRVSKHNQDYIWTDESNQVYIVADGMGGQDAGELASELAATTTGQFITARLQAQATAAVVKEIMSAALEAANKTVMRAAQAAKQDRPMGAAIVVAVVRPPTAYISHAGDARAYLIQQATVSRLTTDDSWVAQLVANGVITEEQAEHHPLGHILIKAVGHESPLEPAFKEVKVTSGDWLLLCSDGLWKMLNHEQFLAVLQSPETTPASAAETLVEAANAAGGKDNISIILIKITT